MLHVTGLLSSTKRPTTTTTSKTTQENYPTGKTAPSATGPGGLAPWALWFYGVFSLQVDRRRDGKREESPREVTSVSSPSEPLIGVLLRVLTSMPATKPSAFFGVKSQEPVVEWILDPLCMRSVVGPDDSSRNGEWSSPWIPSSNVIITPL